jgi:hypothetical protein
MDEDRDDPRLPEPLIGELSRVYRADLRISPEADRVILNGARAHLAGRGRLRLFIRAAVGAVAAVVVVAVVLVNRPARQVTAIVGDVTNDGAVDIRDALLLARRLDAGERVRQDMNHDGVTDRRDVDAIAMAAVQLQ